jgi:hypothetical protein
VFSIIYWHIHRFVSGFSIIVRHFHRFVSRFLVIHGGFSIIVRHFHRFVSGFFVIHRDKDLIYSDFDLFLGQNAIIYGDKDRNHKDKEVFVSENDRSGARHRSRVPCRQARQPASHYCVTVDDVQFARPSPAAMHTCPPSLPPHPLRHWEPLVHAAPTARVATQTAVLVSQVPPKQRGVLDEGSQALPGAKNVGVTQWFVESHESPDWQSVVAWQLSPTPATVLGNSSAQTPLLQLDDMH